MNTTQDTYVRARIDAATKTQAAKTLADMGLSVSDAIRLMLVQVVAERRLPFEVKVPNRETLEAIEELEAGKGNKSRTVKEFMAALNADD